MLMITFYLFSEKVLTSVLILLADRTNGRACATVLRLSFVVCLYRMYCG